MKLEWVPNHESMRQGAVGGPHIDFDLFVDGAYFGMVCTATSRFDPNDGKVCAVIGDVPEQHHFATVPEAKAFVERAARGDA